MIAITLGMSLGAYPRGHARPPESTSAPVNTTPPALFGTAQQGQIMTSGTGSWAGAPTGYAYQWNRDAAAIAGSTSATRTLTSADVGHLLSCTVTATNAGGSTSATSAASASVIAPGATTDVLFAYGQSNASAVGTQGLAVDADYVADPYTSIWNGTALVSYQANVSARGVGPQVNGSDAFWGPEAEVIRRYRAANGSRALLLVKLGYPSTGLYPDAANPDWNVDTASDLNDQFRTAVQSAYAAFPAGTTFTPIGAIWTQGEQDATGSVAAAAYQANLAAFIASTRARFLGSTAPFVFARVRSAVSSLPFADAVREAQRQVAIGDARNLLVNLDGITGNATLHPPPAGVRQTGAFYYQALTGTLAPVIISPATASGDENAAITLALAALTAVSWSIAGGADAAYCSIAGSTLTLSARDYETPLDANADNVYEVTIRATQPDGASATQAVAITVTNVNESGSGYAAETDALLARMTGSYSTAEKNAINTLIVGLKTESIWSRLEGLLVFGKSKNATDALLHWNRTLSATNAGCTYTTGISFSSDGSSTKHVDTALDVSAMTRAGAGHLWSSFGLSAVTVNKIILAQTTSGPIELISFPTTTQLSVRHGTTASSTFTQAMATGRYAFNRAAASSGIQSVSYNGGTRQTASTTVAAFPTSATNLALFRSNTSYGAGAVTYFAFANELTAAQEAAFDALIAAYLA